jgi:hypothetical protein
LEEHPLTGSLHAAHLARAAPHARVRLIVFASTCPNAVLGSRPIFIRKRVLPRGNPALTISGRPISKRYSNNREQR